jgi:uncharacterized membrane-anchored protein
MKNLHKLWAGFALALCAALSSLSWAEGQEPAAQEPSAFEAAKKVAKSGPQDITLLSQATLKLPAGYLFIPQPNAAQVMQAMGNPGEDDSLQGLVFPQDDEAGKWFMTVRYEASGYIKDGEAKEWNAEELLSSYKEGTEEANKERKKMGIPGLEILGWAEKPAYDGASHRLVWAMSSKETDAAATDPQGVNYNTYALGREGYFSINLVTELTDLPKYKNDASTILAALNFQDGKRYADFNSSTDKVAEYGLAALVAGVAAKKLGLLALIAAFAAKFAKIIFIAVAAFGGSVWKFFKREKPAVVAREVQDTVSDADS